MECKLTVEQATELLIYGNGTTNVELSAIQRHDIAVLLKAKDAEAGAMRLAAQKIVDIRRAWGRTTVITKHDVEYFGRAAEALEASLSTTAGADLLAELKVKDERIAELEADSAQLQRVLDEIIKETGVCSREDSLKVLRIRSMAINYTVPHPGRAILDRLQATETERDTLQAKVGIMADALHNHREWLVNSIGRERDQDDILDEIDSIHTALSGDTGRVKVMRDALEKALELAKEVDGIYGAGCNQRRTELINTITAALSGGIIKAMQWISVNDRLPEPDENCLFYDSLSCHFRGKILKGWYSKLDNFIDDSWQSRYPTHWMPLPVPPTAALSGEVQHDS